MALPLNCQAGEVPEVPVGDDGVAEGFVVGLREEMDSTQTPEKLGVWHVELKRAFLALHWGGVPGRHVCVCAHVYSEPHSSSSLWGTITTDHLGCSEISRVDAHLCHFPNWPHCPCCVQHCSDLLGPLRLLHCAI